MSVAVLELCEGSEGRWALGVKRHCPVCLKTSTQIAKLTDTTGNGAIIPRHGTSKK